MKWYTFMYIYLHIYTFMRYTFTVCYRALQFVTVKSCLSEMIHAYMFTYMYTHIYKSMRYTFTVCLSQSRVVGWNDTFFSWSLWKVRSEYSWIRFSSNETYEANKVYYFFNWGAPRGFQLCCSVLQCVAELCSVLTCVAVCCSVLQCVAVCCSVMQSAQ